MRVSFMLASAALAVAAPVFGVSAATVLFSQNFDALPQGIPAASVPGFTITGTVDIVSSGNFSIDCVGGTGACLDIDGTPGPGSIKSVPINFVAGRQITLSFDLSGNQRDSETDNFNFAFDFGALTDITGYSCTSGFIGCISGNYTLPGSGLYNENIPGTGNWTSYSLRFTPVQSGFLQLSFGSTSANNIGPVLDNVLVTQAGVPEPQSWALLIAGFGLVGAARRNRRRALTA